MVILVSSFEDSLFTSIFIYFSAGRHDNAVDSVGGPVDSSVYFFPFTYSFVRLQMSEFEDACVSVACNTDIPNPGATPYAICRDAIYF